MLNYLAFFRPGIWEILLILLIVLLLFGATRLPGIGQALGKAIRGFRESAKGEDEKGDKGSSEPRPPSSSTENRT